MSFLYSALDVKWTTYQGLISNYLDLWKCGFNVGSELTEKVLDVTTGFVKSYLDRLIKRNSGRVAQFWLNHSQGQSIIFKFFNLNFIASLDVLNLEASLSIASSKEILSPLDL